MFKHKKLEIAVLLLALVVIASASQAGIAAPADRPTKSSAKAGTIKYISLGPAAFVPAASTTNF
ncbi:MAG: hypothetical protein N2D54_12325, partial [Chloroflexota bacterium]